MSKIKSLTNFIISPLNGEQYINKKKIGDSEIIINTSIEDHLDTQRIGVVQSVPLTYKGEVRKGDEVVVHHNVFRITYNDKGVPMQSIYHVEDNLFSITPDMMYMIIRDGKKMAFDDNVFIQPFNHEDKWEGLKEMQHTGIVRYASEALKLSGIKEGDTIAFRKNCEYEFVIDNERLYNMKNHRILAKLKSNQ